MSRPTDFTDEEYFGDGIADAYTVEPTKGICGAELEGHTCMRPKGHEKQPVADAADHVEQCDDAQFRWRLHELDAHVEGMISRGTVTLADGTVREKTDAEFRARLKEPR